MRRYERDLLFSLASGPRQGRSAGWSRLGWAKWNSSQLWAPGAFLPFHVTPTPGGSGLSAC